METKLSSNSKQCNFNQLQINKILFEKFIQGIGKVVIYFDAKLYALIDKNIYPVEIRLTPNNLTITENEAYKLIQELDKTLFKHHFQVIKDRLHITITTQPKLLGGGLCSSKSAQSLEKEKQELLPIPNIEQIQLQSSLDRIANQLKDCLVNDTLNGALQAIQQLGRVEIEMVPDPQIILDNLLETVLDAKHTAQREVIFIKLTQLIDGYARLLYAKTKHNLPRDVENKKLLINKIEKIMAIWEDHESLGYDISYHLESAKTIIELSQDTNKIDYTQHFLDIGSTVINWVSNGSICTNKSPEIADTLASYILGSFKEFNSKRQMHKVLLFDKLRGDIHFTIAEQRSKIIHQAQNYLQQALDSKNVDWKVLYAGINFLGQCLIMVTDLELSKQILLGFNDVKDGKTIHCSGILELGSFSSNINLQSLFNYKEYSLCIRTKVVQICLLFLDSFNISMKSYTHEKGFDLLEAKVKEFINERKEKETDPKIRLLLTNPSYQLEIEKILAHDWQYTSSQNILQKLFEHQNNVKKNTRSITDQVIDRKFLINYMRDYNSGLYKNREPMLNTIDKTQHSIQNLQFNLVPDTHSNKAEKNLTNLSFSKLLNIFKLKNAPNSEYKILLLGQPSMRNNIARKYLIAPCQTDIYLANKFKLVIYISMDNLNNNYYKNKKRTLAQMFYYECFAGHYDKFSQQQLSELKGVLEEMRQDTLVIIDNYDESVETVKKGGNIEIAFEELCSFPYIIITSTSIDNEYNHIKPNIVIKIKS